MKLHQDHNSDNLYDRHRLLSKYYVSGRWDSKNKVHQRIHCRDAFLRIRQFLNEVDLLRVVSLLIDRVQIGCA